MTQTIPSPSAERRARVIPLAGAALCGVLVGALAVTTLSAHHEAALKPASPQPGLRHEGAQVVVPEHSAYRDALGIEPVGQRVSAQMRPLPATVEADPADVVTVLPPLGGRVLNVAVEIGDAVHAGQVLVRIESGDLAQARADAQKAAAQLDLTRRALARATGLGQIGGGAAKDVESARNDFVQAQAENTRAQTRLRAILGAGREDGSGLVITAPIDGVVTALNTAAGNYVNDTTQPLMTISGVSHVLVTALAAEDDLGFVAAGETADIGFAPWPGQVRHGVVQSVDAITQSDTRRTKLRVRLDNPDGRLRVGMFATVRLAGPQHAVLSVPDAALLMNNDSTTVFVETRPWVFERRVVQTGADQDGRTIVESGLAAGDRIVARGAVLLGD